MMNTVMTRFPPPLARRQAGRALRPADLAGRQFAGLMNCASVYSSVRGE
jgi:hypothetical protein